MPPSDAPDPHAEALDELVQLGMMVARAVAADIASARSPDPAHVAAFDRAARAVRRTVLLARKLNEPSFRARRRTEARARVIREVEDAIARDGEGPEHSDTLRAKLAERLDHPEFDDELHSRPVVDIILDIRRDLGLENTPDGAPWPRRTPEQAQDLRHRAAARPDRPSPPPRPRRRPLPEHLLVALRDRNPPDD